MKSLLLSIEETAQILSIGKTKLYAELSAGNIKAVKIGKRTLFPKENINKYIESLQEYFSGTNVKGDKHD